MEPLLFLSHRIPYPPNKGEKIRALQAVRLLSERYDIYLGTFDDVGGDSGWPEKLLPLCAEVRTVDARPLKWFWLPFIALLKGRPPSFGYFASHELRRWIRDTVREKRIRKVYIFSSAMGQYMGDIGSDDIFRVVDFVDVDSDKWAQFALRKPRPARWVFGLEAWLLRQWEHRIAAWSDRALFISEQEADLFQRRTRKFGEKIAWWPNSVDTQYFDPQVRHPNPFPDGQNPLVFTGVMNYWPNVDAVCWFARDILPKIRAAGRDTSFFIVGRHPCAEVRSLSRLPGVTVTGEVEDVRPYLQHAGVVVAPMRIARGVQNKVLEAMAMGCSTVTTNPAMEGIVRCPRLSYYVTDSADEFAQMCINNLDCKAAGGLAKPGVRFCIQQTYEWNRVKEQALAAMHPLIDESAFVASKRGCNPDVTADNTG